MHKLIAFILRMVLRSCNNKFAMRTEIGEHAHVYFELKTLCKLLLHLHRLDHSNIWRSEASFVSMRVVLIL